MYDQPLQIPYLFFNFEENLEKLVTLILKKYSINSRKLNGKLINNSKH